MLNFFVADQCTKRHNKNSKPTCLDVFDKNLHALLRSGQLNFNYFLCILNAVCNFWTSLQTCASWPLLSVHLLNVSLFAVLCIFENSASHNQNRTRRRFFLINKIFWIELISVIVVSFRAFNYTFVFQLFFWNTNKCHDSLMFLSRNIYLKWFFLYPRPSHLLRRKVFSFIQKLVIFTGAKWHSKLICSSGCPNLHNTFIAHLS